MYEQFIRERITELRLEKGISEYQMSLDLGHSKNYIRNITSGKTLPAMGEFFYICEYFRITPKQFFEVDSENHKSIHFNELCTIVQDFSDDDIELLILIAQRIKHD